MPTARELLDRADALMRRNRNRGKDRGDGPATLTDALHARRDGMLAPTVVLPDAARSDVTLIGPDVLDGADPISLETLSDVPVLTDVVDVWPGSRRDESRAEPQATSPASPEEAPADAMQLVDETSEPLPVEPTEAVPVRAVALHEAPEPNAGAATAPGAEEEFILELPPAPVQDAAPAAPPLAEWPPYEVPAEPPALPLPPVASSVDWDAMAEEIRMQVLQRLDLFTDTGLRDQLGARLQPIVDQASAELVATINRELGELVRGYVAEAIEREIESFRRKS